jgi:apolipoprotein N-acyltransferase
MPSFISPLRNPTACALLSGLLLVLSFPRAQLSLLALVALAPLVAAVCLPRSRPRLFFLGYLAGLVFFAGTCYWIFDVMHIYGHLPVLAAGGVLFLFVLGFALFFGVFSLLIGELARRWQLIALAMVPFAWVAVEWLRTYIFFGGFPWNLLGYAVVPHGAWIQSAAYAGVYGVSFLVAGVNALIAAYWLAPSPRRAALLAAVLVVLAGGELWFGTLPAYPTDRTALLVQTNLPQQEEFDSAWVRKHPEEIAALEQATLEAVRRAPGPPPDLVVWPEVPVSFYFHLDPAVRGRFLHLAQATGGHLLLGIVDYRADEDGKQYPYNSAILLSPSGEFIGQYDKMHLVPFGEYLPLQSWLRSLGPLVDEVSHFRPGSEPVVLPAGEARLGTFICFEAVFPALIRRFPEHGADLLVNISNDGWFGRSAAPAQHLNMARMRAVETRRFLVRATNTGISAVVDPLGRVAVQAPTHVRATLTAGYAYRSEQTFYVLNGDWFAALCALLTLGVLARKLWVAAVEGSAHAAD